MRTASGVVCTDTAVFSPLPGIDYYGILSGSGTDCREVYKNVLRYLAGSQIIVGEKSYPPTKQKTRMMWH